MEQKLLVEKISKLDDEIFDRIQEEFSLQFKTTFDDRFAKKCVVIVPSLTLNEDLLSRIKAHVHYEERMLCLLLLLRMPNTHVVFVSSIPVDPVIVTYYLQQLPGVPLDHAMRRLTLINCYDSSSKPLIEKILCRPRTIERIKDAIPTGTATHLTCFNVTEAEQKLAVHLGIPIYGCKPTLYNLGSKSNSRKIFRDCGLLVPNGFEDLHSRDEVLDALTELKIKTPSLTKAVVKLDEGFSGEGNAIYFYPQPFDYSNARQCIDQSMATQLKIVAKDLNESSYFLELAEMGGIVEEFIEGNVKMSPSVQCRINPLGHSKVISTHDQLIGGSNMQEFLGAYFPAHKDYAVDIGKMGLKVADYLHHKGVLGRFGVDFISVWKDGAWMHYAIEINLRKGGTTHPYLLLELLTDGDYDYKRGEYYTASKQKRFYFCTDNLQNEKYQGLTPPDLMDIVLMNDLLYNNVTQEGVMFHLIGALSQYGKLGMLCIGSSPEKAKEYYENTLKVLDKAC